MQKCRDDSYSNVSNHRDLFTKKPSQYAQLTQKISEVQIKLSSLLQKQQQQQCCHHQATANDSLNDGEDIESIVNQGVFNGDYDTRFVTSKIEDQISDDPDMFRVIKDIIGDDDDNTNKNKQDMMIHGSSNNEIDDESSSLVDILQQAASDNTFDVFDMFDDNNNKHGSDKVLSPLRLFNCDSGGRIDEDDAVVVDGNGISSNTATPTINYTACKRFQEAAHDENKQDVMMYNIDDSSTFNNDTFDVFKSIVVDNNNDDETLATPLPFRRRHTINNSTDHNREQQLVSAVAPASSPQQQSRRNSYSGAMYINPSAKHNNKKISSLMKKQQRIQRKNQLCKFELSLQSSLKSHTILSNYDCKVLKLSCISNTMKATDKSRKFIIKSLHKRSNNIWKYCK